MFHGHSAHVFQGVEAYKGRLIMYDTGARCCCRMLEAISPLNARPLTRSQTTFVAPPQPLPSFPSFAGDFIDDYARDEQLRNDWGFLFTVHWRPPAATSRDQRQQQVQSTGVAAAASTSGGAQASQQQQQQPQQQDQGPDDRHGYMEALELTPVFLEYAETHVARGEEAAPILSRMQQLSGELGTQLEQRGGKLFYRFPAPGAAQPASSGGGVGAAQSSSLSAQQQQGVDNALGQPEGHWAI